MKSRNIKFAFLVHPRDIADIKKKYFFANFIPEKILKFAIKFLNPRAVSVVSGLKDKNGEDITGLIIGVLLTPDQMLNLKRDFVQKKIIKAVKLAERKGAKIVGLGAFTSSVTNGGVDLIGKVGAGITNGNSLTILIVCEDITKIIYKYNLGADKHSFAVVGATGSVGSLVSRFLAKEKIKRLHLVGRTLSNLEKLKLEIKQLNPDCEPIVSNDLNILKSVDLIILTTAAADAVIKSEYLKQGAIIYDITQPSNISRNVLNRKDIVAIRGGIVKMPGIGYRLDFGLPKETVFACLAETMLLAKNGRFDNFSLGETNFDRMKEMRYYFKETVFKSNYGE